MTLRELFVEGNRYSPGQKVSIEELTRELGVSRTPLWGAVYRLEAEGIVEIVPRLGVYLVNYDPARLIDIYLAREALEGMAARLAAEKVTDRQVEALRANIDRQRMLLQKGEYETYQSTAIEFHEEIVRIAQNATLERLLSSIYAQIKAMKVQRKTLPPMHLPQSCDDHARLLAAFVQRDVNLAEQISRSHIRDLTAQIREQTIQPLKPARGRRLGPALNADNR